MANEKNKISLDEIRALVADTLKDYYPLLESPEVI